MVMSKGARECPLSSSLNKSLPTHTRAIIQNDVLRYLPFCEWCCNSHRLLVASIMRDMTTTRSIHTNDQSTHTPKDPRIYGIVLWQSDMNEAGEKVNKSALHIIQSRGPR